MKPLQFVRAATLAHTAVSPTKKRKQEQRQEEDVIERVLNQSKHYENEVENLRNHGVNSVKQFKDKIKLFADLGHGYFIDEIVASKYGFQSMALLELMMDHTDDASFCKVWRHSTAVQEKLASLDKDSLVRQEYIIGLHMHKYHCKCNQ